MTGVDFDENEYPRKGVREWRTPERVLGSVRKGTLGTTEVPEHIFLFLSVFVILLHEEKAITSHQHQLIHRSFLYMLNTIYSI